MASSAVVFLRNSQDPPQQNQLGWGTRQPACLGSGVVWQAELVLRLAGVALGDDESNVVLLFVRAVAADVFDHRFDPQMRGQVAVALQAFDQALLAELLARSVGSFGNTIGVKRERVAGVEGGFADRAVPFFEEPEDGGGRVKTLNTIVAAKK